LQIHELVRGERNVPPAVPALSADLDREVRYSDGQVVEEAPVVEEAQVEGVVVVVAGGVVGDLSPAEGLCVVGGEGGRLLSDALDHSLLASSRDGSDELDEVGAGSQQHDRTEEDYYFHKQILISAAFELPLPTANSKDMTSAN
jgi:hypothetical protein